SSGRKSPSSSPSMSRSSNSSKSSNITYKLQTTLLRLKVQFVFHLGKILDDQFFVQMVTCPAVDHLSPDLVLAEILAVVGCKKTMILFEYMIAVRRFFLGVYRAFQVFVGDPKFDLERDVGGVKEPQIDVIKENARSAAERQNTVLVRKWVEAVVVAFNDLQRRMKSHPVKQIRKLTQSAADTADDLAARKLHSFAVT